MCRSGRSGHSRTGRAAPAAPAAPCALLGYKDHGYKDGLSVMLGAVRGRGKCLHGQGGVFAAWKGKERIFSAHLGLTC